MNNLELYKLLNEVILNAENCYSAFNKLSCETRVSFSFYATDLYEAKRFLKGWMNEVGKYLTDEEKSSLDF